MFLFTVYDYEVPSREHLALGQQFARPALHDSRGVGNRVDTHGQARGTSSTTGFARRPSGEASFTHGPARGTLPCGLFENIQSHARQLAVLLRDMEPPLIREPDGHLVHGKDRLGHILFLSVLIIAA